MPLNNVVFFMLVAWIVAIHSALMFCYSLGEFCQLILAINVRGD